MPFKIAIASGKGGTGKTTVALNLYKYFKDNICDSIQLVDCDVEEPNTLLFFNSLQKLADETIAQLIPVIDVEKCTFCKKCVEYCEFNAITIIPSSKYVNVSADLCHSCGACTVACNYSAITEVPQHIGNVVKYTSATKDMITEGRLKIGSPMQTMLIKELKSRTAKNTDVVIYDAPPGTNCPVVETISDANFVVLVAEPTPFGLHDLKLTVELIQELKIPFGIVINKAGIGNHETYDFISENNIKLLGEIPFNKEYAKSYAKGEMFGENYNLVKPYYKKIAKSIEKELVEYEGNNYFIW